MIGAALVFLAFIFLGFILGRDTKAGKTLQDSLKSSTKHTNVIVDKYASIAEVQRALRAAGLESSQLICAVDFTKSNTWNGEKSFGGESLHTINPGFDAALAEYRRCKRLHEKQAAAETNVKVLRKHGGMIGITDGAMDAAAPPPYDEFAAEQEVERAFNAVMAKANPYQRVLATMGRTLEAFDDDKRIPLLGFGDSLSTDKNVTEIGARRLRPVEPSERAPPESEWCQGFENVLDRYTDAARRLTLLGPTSFAPTIRRAMELARAEGGYHILLIICDGQVTNEAETIKAICDAAKDARSAISVVAVGVGDGPWETMEEFDDGLPQRLFDNFQFVDYSRVCESEAMFATAALQEIPEQFSTLRRLGRI